MLKLTATGFFFEEDKISCKTGHFLSTSFAHIRKCLKKNNNSGDITILETSHHDRKSSSMHENKKEGIWCIIDNTKPLHAQDKIQMGFIVCKQTGKNSNIKCYL